MIFSTISTSSPSYTILDKVKTIYRIYKNINTTNIKFIQIKIMSIEQSKIMTVRFNKTSIIIKLKKEIIWWVGLISFLNQSGIFLLLFLNLLGEGNHMDIK